MGFGRIGYFFKNEHNMLENPNFRVWFFLGRGGLVVGEGGNGYLVLGFGDPHGCGSRACFPTLFCAFCLYFASFSYTFILYWWFFIIFLGLFLLICSFEFNICL